MVDVFGEKETLTSLSILLVNNCSSGDSNCIFNVTKIEDIYESHGCNFSNRYSVVIKARAGHSFLLISLLPSFGISMGFYLDARVVDLQETKHFFQVEDSSFHRQNRPNRKGQTPREKRPSHEVEKFVPYSVDWREWGSNTSRQDEVGNGGLEGVGIEHEQAR